MVKTIDLKKIQDSKERRTNMYIWKNLDHLKEAYSDFVDREEIDEIVSKINVSGKFIERETVTKEENEAGMCNLVEKKVLRLLEKRDYKIIGRD